VPTFTGGHRIGIGPGSDQLLGGRAVVLCNSVMKRRAGEFTSLTSTAVGVWIGTMGQQQSNHRHMPQTGCQMKRCLAVLISGIDISPTGDQFSNPLTVATLNRIVKRLGPTRLVAIASTQEQHRYQQQEPGPSHLQVLEIRVYPFSARHLAMER